MCIPRMMMCILPPHMITPGRIQKHTSCLTPFLPITIHDSPAEGVCPCQLCAC